MELDLRNALEFVGKLIVNSLRNALESEGKIATRNAYISLDYEIDKDGSIRITGGEELKFINQGRSPGTFPPVTELKEWVVFRDIKIEWNGRMLDDDQATYLIGKAIAENGIPATGIIDRTIDELSDNIASSYVDVYYDFFKKRLNE